jgi:hypothetical protein
MNGGKTLSGPGLLRGNQLKRSVLRGATDDVALRFHISCYQGRFSLSA